MATLDVVTLVEGTPQLRVPAVTDTYRMPVSLAMNATKITGVADPTLAQDAATKAYVDSVAAGLDVKPSAICATTANITLSGEQTLDAILTSASRVVVKNQSAPAENGVYVSAAGAWARATDMDTWLEVPGAFLFIETGTLYADTGWVCTANAGGTIGTTAITWAQFSGVGSYTAGTGLALTGTQFAIDSTVATLTGSQTLTNKTLTAPAIGTPVSGVATNLTGTAAGLTAGNVTTNANLTGHITSTGNAAILGAFTSLQLLTALTDETGTGAAVFANSPTLVTPALGTPASGVMTNVSGTAASLTAGQATAALGVLSATTTVSVSGATAPTTGQVLTATSSTAATWQAPTGGAATSLSGTGATVTTDTPVISVTQTWNAGAVAFTAIKSNVTNTASAAASLLMDLQVGGVSAFKVRKDGFVTLPSTVGIVFGTETALNSASSSMRTLVSALNAWFPHSAKSFWIGSDGTFGFGSTTNPETQDGAFSRISANVVGLGSGAAADVTGQLQLRTVRTIALTVATLPAAATAGSGARAYVSDALAPTFGAAVASGGAVGVPVFSTGSAWNVG